MLLRIVQRVRFSLILVACGLGLIVGASKTSHAQAELRERYSGIPQPTESGGLQFKFAAPEASIVRLNSSDLPLAGRAGVELQKGEDGVWSVTIESLAPGAYRYQYQVDGATVLDPSNPQTSQANATVWNLAIMPGDERFDVQTNQRGAIAQLSYFNEELGIQRRAHVYTPPGYETSNDAYPVFYLLHGATDSDASWSTVGRAAVILDNFIAAGKARPMIVVMPDGHTAPFRFGPGGGVSFEDQMAEFRNDFTKVLRPLIEKRYRTIEARSGRAIGGLSMGGFQTLDIAFAQPQDFGYVMVMSSGLFGFEGGQGREPNRSWEEAHANELAAASTKEGLQLFWFGCGKDDFLLGTAKATVSIFESHDFKVEYAETEGGHTWFNWRNYLADLAPRLFQP